MPNARRSAAAPARADHEGGKVEPFGEQSPRLSTTGVVPLWVLCARSDLHRRSRSFVARRLGELQRNRKAPRRTARAVARRIGPWLPRTHPARRPERRPQRRRARRRAARQSSGARKATRGDSRRASATDIAPVHVQLEPSADRRLPLLDSLQRRGLPRAVFCFPRTARQRSALHVLRSPHASPASQRQRRTASRPAPLTRWRVRRRSTPFRHQRLDGDE